MLIFLGMTYSMKLVRKEAYILLLIAVEKLIFSSLLIFDNWGQSLWHEGFLNYFILGFVLSAVWILGDKYVEKLDDF